MALNLEPDNVGVVVFGNDKLIKEGDMSREPELLWTSQLVWRSLDVLSTLWVTLLMARDLLPARRDTELVSRPLESSPDNLSRSPCRLVSRLLTAWSPLVEARES